MVIYNNMNYDSVTSLCIMTYKYNIFNPDPTPYSNPNLNLHQSYWRPAFLKKFWTNKNKNDRALSRFSTRRKGTSAPRAKFRVMENRL
jgi:hypothetical protein